MAKKNEAAIAIEDEIEIPDGKIADYITGKFLKETEQEQVRQNFERTLVEEYDYPPNDIRVDFSIKVWEGDKQRTKKAPVVVMHEGKEDIYILLMIASPKGN